MEYSVGQLVKKLLKRWYVVLIVALLFAGSSLILSQMSYVRAVREYNQHTTETRPELTGTMTAEFNYSMRESIVELLQGVSSAQISQNDRTDTLVAMANTYVRDNVIEEKVQEVLVGEMDEEIAPGYDILSCIQLSYFRNNTFSVKISGMEEAAANAVVETIATVLNEDHLIQVSYTKGEFAFDDPELTEHALFSHTVMQEPVGKPNYIKTGGTSAVFGFAVACIGILLVQFVKESKEQENFDAESHEN